MSLPKLPRKGCKCHYCTVSQLRKWDWLTPRVRTYIDLRYCPEKYLAYWKLWMQSHTSPCPKAPWGGKYTALEQFTTAEHVLDKYVQDRINKQLDRGQDTVKKGKCHTNEE